MSTLLRTSGVALLLLLLFVVILAAMPLPSAKPRFTTPEWIGPVDLVDVAAEVILRDKALWVVDGRISEIVDMQSLSSADRKRIVAPKGSYVVTFSAIFSEPITKPNVAIQRCLIEIGHRLSVPTGILAVAKGIISS